MLSNERYRDFERLFADRSTPFAFVDLNAMWHNAAEMLGRAGTKPVRVATKSIRCRDLLQRIDSHQERFSGVMTFTLAESLWLAAMGVRDILLAYPTTDREGIRRCAQLEAEVRPVLMVDSVEHLDLIRDAAPHPASPLPVCLDIDLGYRRGGGRLRFGPRRSPIRTAAHAVDLATEIARRSEVELVGVMGYEGHLAGVGDRPIGRPLRGRALSALQSRWVADARERRAELVAAIAQVTPIRFVNGGGTGSLHLTARESVVTEVTAGSGFFAPALFDAYRAFRLRPAAFFVMPVVRRPSPGVVTVLGGGYIASGAPDRDRQPVPWFPPGLALDALEGAGEVQTPLTGRAAEDLGLGDRVYFRHAKAGELCERFDSLVLVENGAIVDEVPTYRGEQKAFL